MQFNKFQNFLKQVINKDTIITKVEMALNSMRPFLQADGGDVELIEITPDNEVKIKLLGTCSNCSMSHMTMKAGIESGLKNAIPEIKSVVAVN